MSKALYRKYRSKSLDEIVGQQHITGILRRAIDKDKVAHAYLLTGPRGVGKTSIARILAHEINKLPYTEESTHLDIIEIDAASNNSVEDVRDLREKVRIAPVSAKHKVYIIDEVHMLSKQAFNALLKTLEEPPEHIVFILATTDADKLPATIISRVQRLNFRSIKPSDATEHLKTIAGQENIAIDDDALELIAHHGKGSFRDSISLLDQMQHIQDGTITRADVAAVLGLAESDNLDNLLASYQAGDLQTTVEQLDAIADQGTPATLIAEQLIGVIRTRITHSPELLPLLDGLLDVPKSAWPEIKLLTVLTHHAATAQPASITAPSPKPIKKQQPTPEPTQQAVPEPTPVPVADTPPPKPSTVDSTTFDWDMFVTDVKGDSAGAAIILKTCDYTLTGSDLTIHAGKKFNKTKLDKALPELNAALEKQSANLTITITDSPKPPADATTAAILDIMGGGEEISA